MRHDWKVLALIKGSTSTNASLFPFCGVTLSRRGWPLMALCIRKPGTPTQYTYVCSRIGDMMWTTSCIAILYFRFTLYSALKLSQCKDNVKWMFQQKRLSHWAPLAWGKIIWHLALSNLFSEELLKPSQLTLKLLPSVQFQSKSFYLRM